MPGFNIYYFIVKPTPTPVFVGTTGTPTRIDISAEQVVQIRAEFRRMFAENLQTLFSACTQHIPQQSSRSINVSVHEIPATSPGVPNFSSVGTIQMHDPIVYIVNHNPPRPPQPVDRRPSDVLYDAISRGYREFSGLSRPRHSEAQGGLSTAFSSGTQPSGNILTAPLVAEVYHDAYVNYDAQNCYQNQARHLANIAFHEIAHLKAECTNRPAGPAWSNTAITVSIHDYEPTQAPDALIRIGTAHYTPQTDLDRRLMGQHMLCPLPFYKLDQDVAAQCFSRGVYTAPTPR
ncbi:MAG: hypothetical protein KJ737_20900 [Proteobacteria bacterium]|nr:hypothetical protein [Pseudomonadota bacterium]